MGSSWINRFYTDFDTENREGYPRAQDYRTPFQVDRDRVIHTTAFRRLQSKTQVFLSREYDLYRTRLTHSLEVAQIGRAICHHLWRSSDLLADDFHVDPDLVEAACLAHDLGHPPFGHMGERTLHELMLPWGGFEGNAQTARLLTETIYANAAKHSQTGMNPTRAFLDSVLKYKSFLRETPIAANHFLYDEQEAWLKFAFGDVWEALLAIPAGSERNAFRSLECQIMDWADDTAYSIHDIVDGITLGFLSIEKIERWAASQSPSDQECAWLEELLRSVRGQSIERTLGRKIGDFIRATSLVERDATLLTKQSNRYRFRLSVDPSSQAEAGFYKKVALDLVFRSAQLHQLDFKSNQMLRQLWQAFAEQYLGGNPRWKLVPDLTEGLLVAARDERQRARLLCDALASMTDGFATRTYQRLFEGSAGSIMDPV